ncbi:MAG: Fe-S cluster assembly sulfur transfer protein SufU [Tepidiformaceae bacterium]
MSVPEPAFDELYREMVVDHYRRPRNHGALAEATHRLEGVNPVCGDSVELDVKVVGEVLAELMFRGQGCAISQASASMMTERLKGRSLEEAGGVLAQVRAMLVDGFEPNERELGDLAALQGVSKLPVRVKCAMLGWNVLEKGLGIRP